MSKKVTLGVLAFICLIGVCIFSYGLLLVVGSTSENGNSGWVSFGLGFLALGGFVLAAAVYGLFKANQMKTPSEPTTSTIQLDLPGEVKINQLSCNNCGGSITATDIKIKNNVPVVVCPWCAASYQVSEEPKW